MLDDNILNIFNFIMFISFKVSYNLPVYFVLLCNCSVLSIVSEKYENYNKINKKKKFKESLFLGFIIMHCSLLNNTCTFTNKKCHMSQQKIIIIIACTTHRFQQFVSHQWQSMPELIIF